MIKLPALATLTLGMMLPTTAAGVDRITGSNFATRSEVIAQHGMVASSQSLATQIGVEILNRYEMDRPPGIDCPGLGPPLRNTSSA